MNRNLEALEQFYIAAQRQPGNWRYLLGRADSLFTQGLYEQALQDWQKACMINPKLKERLQEKIQLAQSNVIRLSASW
jgi:tetratricopeptide (TPR) repeat protein